METVQSQIDPLIGAVLGGRYVVLSRIGRGGMGAVYEARTVSVGKLVAVKTLDASAAADVDAVARLEREARAAAAVDSTHVVHVFDAGTTDDGRPYLVMERLVGEDLRARLRRERTLAPVAAVRIACEALEGLARVHAAGIVHRDLKPENIFLVRGDDGGETVKLVDFGISKLAGGAAREGEPDLTRRGVVLGTPAYMSPEQAEGTRALDARADLYSLGAALFECLAGRAPHVAATYEAVVISICTTEAPDVRAFAPETSEPLARVLRRALARDRDARFSSADELRDALLACVSDAHAETLVLPATPSRRRAPLVTRRALGVGASAVAVVVVATAWLRNASRETPAPPSTSATASVSAPPLMAPSASAAAPSETHDAGPAIELAPPASASSARAAAPSATSTPSPTRRIAPGLRIETEYR